jgi:anaerobic selenocysteine-containing dehydrogenase
MSAHGLMHMVISNAHAGDPYKIDTLFMYMANMAWNSSMNTRGVIEMLTDKDENGEYVIPRIIYSDAYSSEMVAYADLILPDTTYLERHDCISPAGPPDLRGRCRRPTRSAGRWSSPTATCAGSRRCCCDLGARLGLPGFVDEDGSPEIPDYADYMVNHERKPGIGPLAGWRGRRGPTGAARPTPTQLDALHREWRLLSCPSRRARISSTVERGLSGLGGRDGLFDSPQPYDVPALFEPLRKFQLAAEGHGDRQPPDRCARGSRLFRPAADLVSAVRGTMSTGNIPSTRSPSARWRCIIPGARRTRGCGRSTADNRSTCPATLGARPGLDDGDWVAIVTIWPRVNPGAG